MSPSKLFAAPILAALAVSISAAESNTVRRRLYEVPCDPSRCVLASFEFSEAISECSGCHPPNSKWNCPTNGNLYEKAFEATTGHSFGPWQTGQCFHKEYEPSFLAFSGPGSFEGDFVRKCPKAQFCACGDVKTKIETLLNSRDTLSKREANDLWWAALADNFHLTQGFDSVSGGSWEHFSVWYDHGDGRSQFCGGIQSFTYSPQTDNSPTHKPNGYTADSCSYVWINSCEFGFKETRTDCGTFGWGTKVTCSVPDSLKNIDAVPANHLTQAADVAPSWSPWSSQSSCNKKCGGGVQTRTRRCHTGSGAFVAKYCEGQSVEETACNTHTCATTTSSCTFSPSCPSGYEKTGWSWCGKWWQPYRRFNCRESQ